MPEFNLLDLSSQDLNERWSTARQARDAAATSHERYYYQGMMDVFWGLLYERDGPGAVLSMSDPEAV